MLTDIYLAECLECNKNIDSRKEFDIKRSPKPTGKVYYEEFCVKFKYANKVTLLITVQFNADANTEQPFPPDIYVEEKDFLPRLNEMNSIIKWNGTDPKSLINLLHDILNEYKNFHITKLKAKPMLYEEYDGLISKANIPLDDIEIYCRDNTTVFRILIDMTSFLSKMTEEYIYERAHAYLQVTYSKMNKVDIEFNPNSLLQSCLGNTKKFKPPIYNTSTSIANYFIKYLEFLKTQIENTVRHKKVKTMLPEAVKSEFEDHLIEMNEEIIMILFKIRDFSFLAELKLPKEFPNVGPTCKLKSIFHLDLSKKEPYSLDIEPYPHSPRWDCEEIITRFKQIVFENVEKFKLKSSGNGKIC